MDRLKGLHVVVVLLVLLLPVVMPTSVVFSERSEVVEEYWYKYRYETSYTMEIMGRTYQNSTWIIAEINAKYYRNGTGEFHVKYVDGPPEIINTLKRLGKDEVTYTMDLHKHSVQDILNAIGKSLSQYVSIQYNIDVEYKGEKDYKGYPVYHYELSGSYTVSSAMFSVTMNIDATIYVHKSMITVVYYYAEMSSESPKISGKVKIELLDSNLPKSASTNQITVSGYRIIVSGPPGAKITLTGRKGDTRLIAANKGDKIGYVMVIDESKKSSYMVLPLEATARNARTYTLAPGENVTIELDRPLDRDVNIETVEAPLIPVYLIIALIIGAIVALAAVAFYLHRRGAKKEEALAPPPPPPPPPPEEGKTVPPPPPPPPATEEMEATKREETG